MPRSKYDDMARVVIKLQERSPGARIKVRAADGAYVELDEREIRETTNVSRQTKIPQSQTYESYMKSLASISQLKLPIPDGVLQDISRNIRILSHFAQPIDTTAISFQALAEASKGIARIGNALKAYGNVFRNIQRIRLPEPFLSDALIATRFNSPMLHTPTYSFPQLQAIETADDLQQRAERNRQQRLLDAYDMILNLELRLREFIETELRKVYDDEWWRCGLPDQIRKDCEALKQEKEERSSTGYPPLYYAYIDDYKTIIVRRDNWKQIFRRFFINKQETETCFLWLGRVRPSVAHSRPLSDNDFLMLTAACNWIHTAILSAPATDMNAK